MAEQQQIKGIKQGQCVSMLALCVNGYQCAVFITHDLVSPAGCYCSRLVQLEAVVGPPSCVYGAAL